MNQLDLQFISAAWHTTTTTSELIPLRQQHAADSPVIGQDIVHPIGISIAMSLWGMTISVEVYFPLNPLFVVNIFLAYSKYAEIYPHNGFMLLMILV